MSQNYTGPPLPYNPSPAPTGPPTAFTTDSPAPFLAAGLQNHSVETAQRILIGVTCMFLALCSISMIGRLTSRRLTRAALGIDDYLSLIALFLLLAMTIEAILQAHYMFDMAKLGPPDIAGIYKMGQLETASQITYNLLMAAARSSVLMLYRRIFTLMHTFFRLTWRICMALVLGYCIALFVTLGFECSPHPMKTLWLHPDMCHISTRVPMILGFLNAALDLCVLLLPLQMVWNLPMPKRQKFLVCGLFGLGLLGVVISIARASILIKLNTPGGGNGVAFSCWSNAEAGVALLCASLPLMRPVLRRAYETFVSRKEDTWFGPQISHDKYGSDEMLTRTFVSHRLSQSASSDAGASHE